jgi:simple sugar transport system ATP-binding protein
MRRLRDEGLGLIFVTHFLDQVYGVSDRITVLRNGKYVGDWDAVDVPRGQLVAHMLGRELKAMEAIEHDAQQAHAADKEKLQQTMPLLEARDAGRKGTVENLNFALRPGQTTGLAGLLGSGRTEAGRLIFGADKTTRGSWLYKGKPVRINSPRKAMKLGFGFLSEDRKTEGIIPDLSVRENIILALQTRRGWWRPISARRQRALADEYIKALRIATPDGEKTIRFLSGGNQQKALIARWLAANPNLLIMDEPTRGIDVGAKAEIEALVTKLRNEGMSVVFISSELDETLRVSEQLVVMRDGKHAETLQGDDINEPRVMKAMAGA